jgi:hypothetical protein
MTSLTAGASLRRSVALALLTLSTSTAGAQATSRAGIESEPLPVPPTLTATRLPSPIRIDGRLDDPAWEAAIPGSGFRQIDPAEGEPATGQTEVRVLYDHQALYVGIRMFDPEPSKIRARLGRRDEGVMGSDLIELLIDSYHDRVSGYLFRLTPAGAMRDAAVNATGAQDNSWDAVWEGAAAIDSLGWTAEFRIPFAQLRYTPRAGMQTFGINFRRVVGRTGESSEFSFTPKRAAGGPQRWATLEGLQGLPRARHLELMPYATARGEYLNVADRHPFRSASEYRAKAGLDLRYGLTSGLTLSATFNPDFGQVEVDPARVNLTANELFFPERRPFFVEGAELFRYGRVQGFNAWPPFPTVFHSRRIGRTPQRRADFIYEFADMPEEATIVAAAKVSGQPRAGLSVGVINAMTARETAGYQDLDGDRGSTVVEPRTNYFVGRVRQDFRLGATQVGALLTAVNRDNADSIIASVLRRDSYFAGLDFTHRWKQHMWLLQGSYSRSAVYGTPAAIAITQRSSVRYFQRPDYESERLDPTRTSLHGDGLQLSVAKVAGRRLVGNLTYQQVSPRFEVNDMGFQSLAGYRVISQGGGIKQDQPGKYLRNWFIGPFSSRRWNYDGDVIHSNLAVWGEMRLLNYWGGWGEIGVDPPWIDDRLTRGGPVVLFPRQRWGAIGLFSDQRRVYTINAGFRFNDQAQAGWEQGAWANFTIRPNPALRLGISPNYNWAHNRVQFLRSAADASADETFGRRYLFGGLRYDQLSVETRVDWTFTPRLSLQVFAQPLIADGVYRSFRVLSTPRSFEFEEFSEATGNLTRDEAGWIAHPTGGAALRIGDPDFRSLSLVGNAVMRWEYRPGSTLFFVWQQRRAESGQPGRFSPGRDVVKVFETAPENVFAIKATYWFGR